MHVKRLIEPETIQPFLEADRRWTAYALGDLDPALFEYTEWYGAEDKGDLQSLVLLYKAYDPPALVTMGDPKGIAVILGAALRAPSVYLMSREEHMPMIHAHYGIESIEPMWRMTLDGQAFEPVAGDVTHLTPQYTHDLEELYRIGGGDAFTPSQVFAGAFFGIQERGRLIAAAGTHVVSEGYRVAAVGNVFTHPDHRGRGYGTVTTSAVCVDLIRRGIRTIVLNVAKSNEGAIRIYERLGFEKYLSFTEGIARRKHIQMSI